MEGTNYIGCIIGICLSFYLSNIESLNKRDNITAITCIGWIIYSFFEKKEIKCHLPQ